MTDTDGAPARRIPTGWFVRIGVSLLVLSVTLWLLPTEEVWGAVQRMPPSIWLLCLVVFLLGHVLSALTLLAMATPLMLAGVSLVAGRWLVRWGTMRRR